MATTESSMEKINCRQVYAFTDKSTPSYRQKYVEGHRRYEGHDTSFTTFEILKLLNPLENSTNVLSLVSPILEEGSPSISFYAPSLDEVKILNTKIIGKLPAETRIVSIFYPHLLDHSDPFQRSSAYMTEGSDAVRAAIEAISIN